MKLLEAPLPLSEVFECLIHGIVCEEPAQAPTGLDTPGGWEDLMGGLEAWEQDPDILDDEGVEPPEPPITRLASDIACMMRDRNMEPPGRVMPNGDGGIVFRWRMGDAAWTVESDRSIESSLARRGRVVCRHSLHEGANFTRWCRRIPGPGV